MDGSLVSRDIGCRLASYIEDRRHEVVASVIRSSILPRPGSGSSVAFANAFLDRLRAELESGDRSNVDRWADSNGEAQDDCDLASAVEHARIVGIVCAWISSSYVADRGRSDEVVSYFALRSSELEARFRDRRAGKTVPAGSPGAERDATVASLLSAMEACDRATCEHSRAVGMWCSRIAKSLGMSAQDQALAALAGTLHDAGKIATPSEILLKPGPLDAAEWEQMRAHSQIGAKMLERVPALAALVPIVRAHHERIDGNGYPDGLKGDAIPLLARIVAVADSFHAMISKRPYRDALPVAFALDELRAGAGTQWDAGVVDVVLAIVQPGGARHTLRAARAAR